MNSDQLHFALTLGSAIVAIFSAGVAVVMWAQSKFTTKNECVLKHESADARAQKIDKAADDLKQRVDEIHDEVLELKTDQGWLMRAVHSIAERVGAEGFQPSDKPLTSRGIVDK